MRTLVVENFSCIKSATIELDKLTVIIGPQASGKSILGKLSYFSIDVGLSHYNSIIKFESFDNFCKSVKERFIEWFPISAWGDEKFKISFTSLDYSITLVRKTYRGKNSSDFRIKFSDAFVESYTENLERFENFNSHKKKSELHYEMEWQWEARRLATDSFVKLMGKFNVRQQAFIPAGRSFFTSVGKAIAAFEQGRVLDPLILRFGRMYTAYKERPVRFFDENSSEKEFRTSVNTVMNSLLGGVLHKDGEKEYVLSSDGRKIPLSALSSGQQELLPIIAIIPWFSMVSREGGALCYIEEPEAHLFPSTQSKLIQALVVAANGASLVITTHSPYVLVKINNLLKAGALGRKQNPALKKELESKIPKRSWLSARTVKAYSICDGIVQPIMGADGFINADYLDEISSDLGKEFESLLDLELSHV